MSEPVANEQGMISYRMFTLAIVIVSLCGIAGLNLLAAILAAYPWRGPIHSMSFGMVAVIFSLAVSTVVFFFVCLFGGKKRTLGLLIAAVSLSVVTAGVSFWQSSEPSASSVFEYEFGFTPDESISNLRSFITLGDIDDETVGLQFTATKDAIDKLLMAVGAGDPFEYELKISSIRDRIARTNNQIPSWFASDKRVARLKVWQIQKETGIFNLYIDTETLTVYFVQQEI